MKRAMMCQGKYRHLKETHRALDSEKRPPQPPTDVLAHTYAIASGLKRNRYYILEMELENLLSEQDMAHSTKDELKVRSVKVPNWGKILLR
jgi:hypothetical protein